MNTQSNRTYPKEDLIFYTPKDLERILQFKSTKIQQLLKQQIIPSVKLGGQYRVSKEQLEELKSVCESVLACNTLAETLLPPDIGWIYGSSEYDEYYYHTLQSTIEIIDKVIAETNWDVETICYKAS